MTLGQGTNFLKTAGPAVEYPYVTGGYRHSGGLTNDTNNYHNCDEVNVTVDIGDENNIGPVYGSLGMLAHAVKADVNIHIISGTINGSVYGDSWGTDASKLCTGSVAITVDGGNVKGTLAVINNGFASSSNSGTMVINGGNFTGTTLANKVSSNGNAASNFVVDCSNATYSTYTQVKAAAGSLTVVAPASKTATNTATGTQYLTLAEALAAATSGQTVKLTDNVTETTVTVPRGVTLNLSNYTLTAKFVVGLEGSKIVGNSAAKLIVPEGNLKVSDDAYSVVSGGNTYSFLPVWDNVKNCYIFSNFMIDTTAGGQTITSNAMGFRFKVLTTSSIMGLMADDGCSNNGMSIILQLRWNVGNKKAVQNFYYSDEQVKVVANGGSYVFTLTNYSQLGINGAQVEIQPMVVTDCGTVLYGNTWVNGAVS